MGLVPILYNTSTTDGSKGTHKHTLYFSSLPSHAHGINHTHNVTTPDHNHSLQIPSHTHGFQVPSHSHDFNVPTHTHNVSAHTHSLTINNHTHTINVPAHTHSLTLRDHTHTLDIPNHTHTITLENHTHNMVYGIYEGSRASNVSVKVDGKTIPVDNTTKELDVATYLSVDGGGKIERGIFHTIEIVPNELTRINATLSVQLFVQSEGGGVY